MQSSRGRDRADSAGGSLPADHVDQQSRSCKRASAIVSLPQTRTDPKIVPFHLLPVVLDQMAAHALSASGEICGFVYRNHYRALRNIAISPERNFFADPTEIAHALFLYGEPPALFHTHTDGNLKLSVVDRNLWYYKNSTMIVGCIYDGRLRWKMYGYRGD